MSMPPARSPREILEPRANVERLRFLGHLVEK